MTDAASEIARLRAALAASEARVETAGARAEAAESELAQARAVVSASEAMIRHLKPEIAKLRREQYGHSSERRARLIDQMELQLEELEAAATEDGIAAGKAPKIATVAGFERRRPVRKPFPEHPLPGSGLSSNRERRPRERVVIDAPSACSCCGSDRIVKMGEDSEPLCAIGSRTMASETLEAIPRQWKVIQTVREKFPGLRPFTPQSVHRTLCRFADRRSPCRACEKISQPPAPFHATPRGWAGPHLLATILFESEPWSAIGPRSCPSRRHRFEPDGRRRAGSISR